MNDFVTVKMPEGGQWRRDYDDGARAKAEDKDRDSNPYAMEMTYDGKTWCPTAFQRDIWWFGYDGDERGFAEFIEADRREADKLRADRIAEKGHDCWDHVVHSVIGGGMDCYDCGVCGDNLQVG